MRLSQTSKKLLELKFRKRCDEIDGRFRPEFERIPRMVRSGASRRFWETKFLEQRTEEAKAFIELCIEHYEQEGIPLDASEIDELVRDIDSRLNRSFQGAAKTGQLSFAGNILEGFRGIVATARRDLVIAMEEQKLKRNLHNETASPVKVSVPSKEMTQTMNPKVFISHASEDKERFVINFGTKLRAKGIDAWIDRWEMLPGDSLVDKIFAEGIKNAQAVIVILSRISVSKKWVREELNASVVKRINDNSKLIPVVIDDCEIPECLQSTVWEKIDDLSNYDENLDRIIMSILGHREKPPLGPLPAYAQTVIDGISGLSKIDSLALKLACEQAIEYGKFDIIGTQEIIDNASRFEISRDEVVESVQWLKENHYIESDEIYGYDLPIPWFTIKTRAFEEFARVYIDGYASTFESVVSQVVNQGKTNNTEIIAELKQPKAIVDHILDLLRDRNLISFSQAMQGMKFNVTATVELKRRLREKTLNQ